MLTDFEAAIFASCYLLRKALCRIVAVMDRGRLTHPSDDWQARPVAEHLAHARAHLEALAAGDNNEDHLAHAVCRLLMALELQER